LNCQQHWQKRAVNAMAYKISSYAGLLQYFSVICNTINLTIKLERVSGILDYGENWRFRIVSRAIGSQVSSVEFVQDYLQVIICNQITKIVTQVTFESEKEFKINFTDRSEINVSVRADDYCSPEAIYCNGFKMMVGLIRADKVLEKFLHLDGSARRNDYGLVYHYYQDTEIRLHKVASHHR
jgi:hypothetical protein